MKNVLTMLSELVSQMVLTSFIFRHYFVVPPASGTGVVPSPGVPPAGGVQPDNPQEGGPSYIQVTPEERQAIERVRFS